MCMHLIQMYIRRLYKDKHTENSVMWWLMIEIHQKLCIWLNICWMKPTLVQGLISRALSYKLISNSLQDYCVIHWLLSGIWIGCIYKILTLLKTDWQYALSMESGMKIICPYRLNNGFDSKFQEGYWRRLEGTVAEILSSITTKERILTKSV